MGGIPRAQALGLSWSHGAADGKVSSVCSVKDGRRDVWKYAWMDGWTDRQQIVRRLNGPVGKQRDGRQGGREESSEEIDTG